MEAIVREVTQPPVVLHQLHILEWLLIIEQA